MTWGNEVGSSSGDLGGSDEFDVALGPPYEFLAVASVLIIVALVLHLFPSTTTHLVGYALGAIGVTATVAAYRNVNRRRSLSGRYSFPRWVLPAPQVMLVSGVGVAMSHAWFLAMVRRLA